jgi:hypothetical protein
MTATKLSEFTEDQLQWMYTHTVIDTKEINDFLERAEKYELTEVLSKKIESNRKKLDDLKQITAQVLNAMVVIKSQELIASN